MRLRAKVLIAIMLVWALIMGGTYIGALQILRKSYASLEQKQVLANLNILNEALQSLSESNLATITSWTNWDTLYNHMKAGAPDNAEDTKKFFQEIINPGSLSSSNVDIYLTFTSQGGPHYSAALNAKRTQLIPVPTEVLQLFAPGGPLRKLIGPAGLNSDAAGLIATQKDILILGAHRILPSIGEGVPRGTGVILTYLTDAVLNKVKEDSKLDLKLYNVSADKLAPDIAKEYSILLTKNMDRIDVNQNSMFLYQLLRDINHQPIAIIKVTAVRSIHLLGKNTIYFFSIAFLLSGIVFSFLLFYLLRFLVIDRLSNINERIQTITSTKNFNLKVMEKGPDEISWMGIEINKMLAMIAEIEVLLTNTIDFMPSIMLILDQGLKVVNLNHFAKKELKTARDVRGSYLFDLFPCLLDYKDKFNHSGGSQEIEQINDLTPQGIKYYKALIYPLRQSGEKNMVLRLDDITQRIQMNKTLMQHDRLSAIGALTAGVAHEINNPINFIVSSVDPLKRNIHNLYTVWEKYAEIKNTHMDLLQKKLNELEQLKQSIDVKYTIEESKQLFNGIHEGIVRIERIMNDLKTFTKGNAGAMIKADIHQGIDATLALLQPNYKDRIEIVKEYGPLPEIECYYGKLNQVFMNIISNAIEAIPNKGTIRIKTEQVDNTIKVTVSDTGVGILESNIKKIFNPFYTTKEIGKGTGLGLSIASSIIQNHQGTIEVSSQQEKGSTFTVTIPVIRDCY